MEEIDNKKLQNTLQTLVSSIDKVYLDRKRLMIRSFISGVFTGLGATIGLSIVLILIGFILHLLGGVPVVGTYVGNVSKVIPSSTTHK